ncbi:PadR family transcriptional regulator [Sporosarcina obsidiansis]|uniref:PadR family transcriptional regulator n=1 Tax=Sporosarcina obsidiansis TaxID=2660748 RepID=UPI00129B9B09|nr:PadR family transcriptional regulator [Sporosarcina obsidiansis]
MEEQLKGLRKAMKNTTFNQLKFSEQHRLQVYKRIHDSQENEEDIILAVLQLLVHDKTGYELVQLVRCRGILQFEENEGSLYTLLHRLEQGKFITSQWDSAGAKYYSLDRKGERLLRKAENGSAVKHLILKEWIQG